MRPYRVSIEPLRDPAGLASEWRTLEESADNSFFLSWHWIGTWLKVYRPDGEVIRARCNGSLVALGILVHKHERRHVLLKSNVVHLHQTGDPTRDQIWIEYNGLLCDRDHDQAVAACIDFLVHEHASWDELRIGAITESSAQEIAHICGLHRHDIWLAPTYGVSLDAVRRRTGGYLTMLSRNTRYQISLAQKRYGGPDAVRLSFAPNESEGLEHLAELGRWHAVRWGRGVHESGFVNPAFCDLHHELIRRNWVHGCIDVVRLLARERPAGYFYHFKYRGQVCFYASAIERATDPKLKPGLPGHALCVEHYAADGMDYYDFMSGDGRYKASLGKQNERLVLITLQKRLLKFRVEHAARTLKHRVLQ